MDSNIYYLNLKEKTIIDTGSRTYKEYIGKSIRKLVNPEEIQNVLFTHLHYDHIGNSDLFPNAKFYASKEEIKCLHKNKGETILDFATRNEFNIKLIPLPKRIAGLEVISTPGHTAGSVCYWYEKEKILFSGDTLFFAGMEGRKDLPTSAPEQMDETIKKIQEIPYKTLCPGHDY